MAGFATIDEALQDLRDGKLILVIDDDRKCKCDGKSGKRINLYADE